MPTTVGHILDNVLISQELTENNGVITIVRPDFSVRVKSEAIKPNSSPARVELDTRTREIRVWSDDRGGSSKPNRVLKNAIVESIIKRKVTCSVCKEMDIDEFTGTDLQSWGRNGWRIEDGVAVCPDCAAVAV
jgi:hypothetical protein